MEIIAREDQRHDDVSILYLETASEILSLPPHLMEPYIPSHDLINSLPKVEEMLEADAETITEEQRMEVVDEVRTLIRRCWGNILRQLVALVETGRPMLAVVPENAVDGHEVETTAEDMDAMVAKLTLVTASFVCKPDVYNCGTLHWFSAMLLHWVPSCGDSAVDISPLLKYCEPLDDERKQLVRRTLGDLGLDAADATEADVTNLKNLICTRCDHHMANYASFGQIVHHYIQAQTWFSAVQRAKQTGFHPQEVINDHDWLLDDATLVRQDSDKEKASLEVLQAEFRLQAATDPTCDIDGVGGEELRRNLVHREIKRSCNLCPNGFGPRNQYPTPDMAENQT
ncbi:hypothetical protein FRC00_004012 [Tulasnella sp. 408]|nr:hypothetical protein FRC00_004012 [Tulasnella sp. 408]